MTAAPRTQPHSPERVKRRHTIGHTPSPGPPAPTQTSPSHATTPLHRLTDESRLGRDRRAERLVVGNVGAADHQRLTRLEVDDLVAGDVDHLPRAAPFHDV